MITPHAHATHDPYADLADCLPTLAVDRRWLNHTHSVVDPFEEIADILPKLARNIGWLRLMGEALVEQKSRQRQTITPISDEQAAHLERKRATRQRRKQRHRGYKGLALAILSPRPIGRGVVVSPAA